MSLYIHRGASRLVIYHHAQRDLNTNHLSTASVHGVHGNAAGTSYARPCIILLATQDTGFPSLPIPAVILITVLGN